MTDKPTAPDTEEPRPNEDAAGTVSEVEPGTALAQTAADNIQAPGDASAADRAKASHGGTAEAPASAKTSPARPQPSPRSRTGRSPMVAVLLALMLVLLAAGGYGVWWGREHWRQVTADVDALRERQTQLLLQQREALNSQAESQNKVLKRIEQKSEQLASQLQAFDERLTAQGKRLSAMADTSREDWLLAEAEYLLKLANQRLRIERNAEGADALLSEADAILRDLAQPELHEARRQIARDLAALRLMQRIDVEGIYLTLSALAQNIEALPYHRTAEARLDAMRELPEAGPAPVGAWERLKASAARAWRGLQSNVRITQHREVAHSPVAKPEDIFYVQQNLRFMLERAQLGLLREQQDVYHQSLAQAQRWLADFYPPSEPVARFAEQLAGLEQETVVQALPDISRSLNVVHEYIEALHNLRGVKAEPGGAGTEVR